MHDLSYQSSLQIPEPTKSLLWITDEDTSKISFPMNIKVNISITGRNINMNINDGHNFYAEPSLIWTRLPIEPNGELESKPMYYPSYAALSPKQRFQYLSWLRNIDQETNLSYVFLYFYGLERQLLVGNYGLAVDEILKLIKYHDMASFKWYATNSLIIGSGYRKRPDILLKAPFLIDTPSDISLYLQRLAKKPLTAEQVIYYSSRVGFTNKRYIKKYPELFRKELQQLLIDYQNKNGDILQNLDLIESSKIAYGVMANISLPDEIRTQKFPDIINNIELKSVLKKILEETHAKIKAMKFTS